MGDREAGLGVAEGDAEDYFADEGAGAVVVLGDGVRCRRVSLAPVP